MRFEVRQRYPGQIPEIEARIQAIGPEFREMIREVLSEAAEQGRKFAEAEAPRSDEPRNYGRRISDSIHVSDISFAAGGAGGGGFYQVKLSANSLIAPHLPFVFEGTADQGIGKIYPARGNVLAFEKHGEGVKFRRWVHGQHQQTRWWEETHFVVEGAIDEGVRGMNLGLI